MDPTIYKDDKYPSICAVRTICTYVGRLTDEQRQPENPFLLNINHAAERNPEKQKNWFMSSPLGKNHIASLFKSAFEALGVDCKAEKISATSARKNFLQGGAESGVPANWLSLAAGHKVEQSQLNYLKMKNNTDKAMSLCINRAVSGVKNQKDTDFRHVLNKEAEKNSSTDGQETEDMTVKQSLHCGMQQSNQMALQCPQPQMQPILHQQMMPQPGPSYLPMSPPQMMPQPGPSYLPMSPPQMMTMMPQQMMSQQMMTQPMMSMYVTQQPAMMPMMHQPPLVYPQQQAMGPQMRTYGYSQQSMFFSPGPNNRQAMMDITNAPGSYRANNDPCRKNQIEYEDKEN